ncbi:hypothetical protein AVEN_147878-1 [Araneus ventricosus]|uniref:Uncharacterized protein n=1 Tax=Araneus ventricosus TaxID=182803 RepID=A0A4Y2X0M4_ARAVE|nr:hypothetical protein AVEN_147878-1 [Araneus ventricosus]
MLFEVSPQEKVHWSQIRFFYFESKLIETEESSANEHCINDNSSIDVPSSSQLLSHHCLKRTLLQISVLQFRKKGNSHWAINEGIRRRRPGMLNDSVTLLYDNTHTARKTQELLQKFKWGVWNNPHAP